MSIPVIFIEKDGTLLEAASNQASVDVNQVKLTAGAIQGLKKLTKAGFRFVIVSNQPGVAEGLFKERAVRRVKRHIRKILQKNRIALLDFYYCPHHPKARVAQYRGKCSCRKPSPGLLWKAKDKHNIDLSKSWFIGDILDDVECGQRAGCHTVLIDNGHEQEWQITPYRKPDGMVVGFKEAVNFILESTEFEKSGPV